MAKNHKFILLVMMPIILASCEEFWYGTSLIERADLYGRYYGNFGETDVNYIDIFEDSVFVCYYKTADGYLLVDTGTWRFLDWNEDQSRSYGLWLWGLNPRHRDACGDTIGLDELINILESDSTIKDIDVSIVKRIDEEINQDTSNVKSFSLYKRRKRIYIDFCPEKYHVYYKILEKKSTD
jgi:hypothetical protein